jgi:acetyl-CoA carboxylase biotin carboxyl carrier protein
MDIRKIKKLIELVEESGISELEISEGEESVRISRAAPAASFPVMQQAYAAPMMQPRHRLPQHRPPLGRRAAQQKSVVTSYVPRWLVLSTAPRARTRKRS